MRAEGVIEPLWEGLSILAALHPIDKGRKDGQ